MGNKAVTIVNGKMKKAGDTDTVDLDGNVNLGNANSDNIVFSGEVDSDIIPDDDNTHDLGSSSKKWAQVHAQQAFFEDYIMAELSIAGLDIQSDNNAFTFNCPYNMTFERMDAYLDTVGGGDLDVEMRNVTDNNQIFLIQNMNSTSASDTTASNQDVDTGDQIRFEISNVTGSPQGLRVNVRFRRR